MNGRLSLILVSVILSSSGNAYSQSFDCSNSDLEITCTKQKCERSENYTPSSVSLNTHSRSLSICLYAICLEGTADRVETSDRYIVAIGSRLKSNSGQHGVGSGVIVIDLDERNGVLVTENFRNPVTCTKR